ncbi:amidohydrolase family protein, partial [bacterium]|nr:amidohydrolase family protein [bacterium]
MAVDLVIKHGEVVTPHGIVKAGIAVDGEKIVAIADEMFLPEGNTTIDASGKIVIPGVIDPHVHTGYPLQHKLDDIETASISGAFGGVTTFLAFFAAADAGKPLELMPAYSEVITSRINVGEYFSELIEDCQKSSVLDFGVHWSLYSGDDPAHVINQIPTAIKMGITDIKIMLGYHPFRGCLLDDMQLMQALETVALNGGLVMVHAENGPALGYLEDKYDAEGRYNQKTFLEARPNMIEAEAVYRVSTLANIVHCPLYIVHNTAKESVRLIREFKFQGQKITAETCPQYLLLTNDDLVEKGVKYKIGPPLRSVEDQNEIWHGIQHGIIDTIGSDHAAAMRTAEDAPGMSFRKQAFGVPGIETALPLVYSEGVA